MCVVHSAPGPWSLAACNVEENVIHIVKGFTASSVMSIVAGEKCTDVTIDVG